MQMYYRTGKLKNMSFWMLRDRLIFLEQMMPMNDSH
jgi:hypothetical protein